MLKIADFGLVFVFEDAEQSCQVSMSAAGTREFMAPEMLLAHIESRRLKGHPYKVDVFSLGVVMYNLLLRTMPFNLIDLISPALDATAMLEKTVSSAELRALLGGMLQRDPTLRPAISEVLRHSYLEGVSNTKYISSEHKLSFE